MQIGLGIDTGGTYTDAVLYDFAQKRILHAAKALTTKEDLSIGIVNAMDALPRDIVGKTEVVSLSTTLATNACVEDRGGRAKLVYIGVDDFIVKDLGRPYGLPDPLEIFFLDGGGDLYGGVKKEPDWDAFNRNIAGAVQDADAVAVVELYGNRNPLFEKKAKEIITGRTGKNVICGYELFDDMNSLKRGASALLNARLIPIIKGFLDAVRTALKKRNIGAPVVIVRSDGTVMSETFTTVRPVETLLCGPAASVLGGMELTGQKDCIVVDMGGTTTDIAIVKKGMPVLSEDGVSVGKWHTCVKAVDVKTFGLGGDSAIRYDNFGRLQIGPVRVMPLCVAASRWPSVKAELKRLAAARTASTLFLHELYYLQRPVDDPAKYTKEEMALCEALKDGPLTLADAAGVYGTDKYNFKIARLEREGIVNRCGLTPTDIMHIRGDFAQFDAEASLYGAEFVGASTKRTVKELCGEVYGRIKKGLYIHVVQMLLEDLHPAYRKNGIGKDLKTLISESWEKAASGASKDDFSQYRFSTKAKLIGIGAPTHIFIEDVAKALDTESVVPEYAGVANALGAVVGNVIVTREVMIKPDYALEGIQGYIVLGKERSYHKDKDEAVAKAVESARQEAGDEAKRRGAAGDILVTSEVQESEAEGVWLGVKAVATAIGRQ